MKVNDRTYFYQIVASIIFVFISGCTQQPVIAPETSPPDSSSAEIATESTILLPTGTSSLIQATQTPVLTMTPTPSPITSIPEKTENQFDIDSTTILYMTATQYAGGNYWALRSWPDYNLALDPSIFETFYGKRIDGVDSMDQSRYFFNFHPQVSPNGRYLTLPGIGGYTHPGGSDLGTGLWLADLQAGTVRQLLPQAKIVTWSPDSEQISYVDEDTLYTLAIDEEGTLQSLFTHSDLWPLYAHWSPDGQWIAVVTMTQREPDEQGSPELTNTYWLVPVNGEAARPLAVRQDFAMEYATGEMAWSPDGQFLLMRNEIFDLPGTQVGGSFPGKIQWLPDQAQLLVNGNEGIRLMTITGDEITMINNGYAAAWAFSHDNKQLAYTQPADVNGINILTYNFDTGNNQLIASLPVDSVFPLYWSGQNTHLIMGGRNDNNVFIWALDLRSSNLTEPFSLFEKAVLIKAVGK
jgi:WD40 repeat protein